MRKKCDWCGKSVKHKKIYLLFSVRIACTSMARARICRNCAAKYNLKTNEWLFNEFKECFVKFVKGITIHHGGSLKPKTPYKPPSFLEGRLLLNKLSRRF